MFGLFGSSGSKIKVIDKVWMSKEAKWNACALMFQVNPACVFIAWFEETRNELVQKLGKDEPVLLADKIQGMNFSDKLVLFAEHYPLSQREQSLFASFNFKEIPVTSSLDEPMFMLFGGEKTIDLVRKLGMKEDEVIGHNMITAAIRNAQKKIEEKVKIEKPAASAQAWFELNLPAKLPSLR